jgi:putative AdoMet-dependent methyltransferase
MFENEKMRRVYMDKLHEEGNLEAIAAIEDEYYTDRSWLEEWLQQHGYAVRSVQINELLHLVCAHPAR